MRTENERLLSEVEKLKQSLKEQIVRTQAGVRLDLNLEKGRIRDEASLHELKIKEVDTRIESEIAGLRTQIQGAKVRPSWSLFFVLSVDDKGTRLTRNSPLNPSSRFFSTWSRSQPEEEHFYSPTVRLQRTSIHACLQDPDHPCPSLFLPRSAIHPLRSTDQVPPSQCPPPAYKFISPLRNIQPGPTPQASRRLSLLDIKSRSPQRKPSFSPRRAASCEERFSHFDLPAFRQRLCANRAVIVLACHSFLEKAGPGGGDCSCF